MGKKSKKDQKPKKVEEKVVKEEPVMKEEKPKKAAKSGDQDLHRLMLEQMGLDPE
jgi:hypothetical protein